MHARDYGEALRALELPSLKPQPPGGCAVTNSFFVTLFASPFLDAPVWQVGRLQGNPASSSILVLPIKFCVLPINF